MMAKENKNIREIIDSVYSEIYDADNYILDLDLYGYTTVRKPFNNEDKPLFYHIYYSDCVKVECTKKIHSQVKELKDCIFRIIPARVLGNCRPHQNGEANLAEGLRKAVRQDIL